MTIPVRRRRSGGHSSPTPAAWSRCSADFGIICFSFLAAYLLFVDGGGTYIQRGIFLAVLPILLGVRYVLFVALRDLPADLALRLGPRPARDRRRGRAVGAADDRNRPCDPSAHRFPAGDLFVDALLCMTLVAASRLALRLLPGLSRARVPQQRVLIVGAGRSGRALARELAETPETRVVGFVDDNPALRRRRIHGVTVHGALDDVERLLGDLQVG